MMHSSQNIEQEEPMPLWPDEECAGNFSMLHGFAPCFDILEHNLVARGGGRKAIDQFGGLG
jgi:hypothetical protein